MDALEYFEYVSIPSPFLDDYQFCMVWIFLGRIPHIYPYTRQEMDGIYRTYSTHMYRWSLTLHPYSTSIFLSFLPMRLHLTLLISLISILSSCTLPGTVSE